VRVGDTIRANDLYLPIELNIWSLVHENKWGNAVVEEKTIARRIPHDQEKPDLPEGWRWLAVGEIIQEDDEFWHHCCSDCKYTGWNKHRFFGQKVVKINHDIRRLD
jgi:hypothetical protein